MPASVHALHPHCPYTRPAARCPAWITALSSVTWLRVGIPPSASLLTSCGTLRNLHFNKLSNVSLIHSWLFHLATFTLRAHIHHGGYIARAGRALMLPHCAPHPNPPPPASTLSKWKHKMPPLLLTHFMALHCTKD